jgi:putative aldouronate transport system permease protein
MDSIRAPAAAGSARVVRGKSDYAIEIISIIVMVLFAICCLAPFLYVFFVSFTPYADYIAHPTRIIPLKPTLDAYKRILTYHLIYTGYRSTLIVTIFGTALSLFMLVITGYPLSKRNLKGGSVVMAMIMFTMFFNGGMVPNYILIRQLGLMNTLGSLIIPGCLGAFNVILIKNFIRSTIPDSLEDSARVDGANDIRILISIIVPLLTPILATMLIFTSVGHWNNYFSAMLYIRDREKWPLMLVLREIVSADTTVVASVQDMLNKEEQAHPFTLRMSTIIVTTLPILVVYPFMQKYFIKGIHLGSVKE